MLRSILVAASLLAPAIALAEPAAPASKPRLVFVERESPVPVQLEAFTGSGRSRSAPRIACRAPCNEWIQTERSTSFVVRGEGLRPSLPIEIATLPRGVRLQVQPGWVLADTVAMACALTGFLGLLWPVIALPILIIGSPSWRAANAEPLLWTTVGIGVGSLALLTTFVSLVGQSETKVEVIPIEPPVEPPTIDDEPEEARPANVPARRRPRSNSI